MTRVQAVTTFIFSIGSVLSVHALAADFQTFQITLPDQRHLIVESTVTTSTSKDFAPWIVYLPGSSNSQFPSAESLWLRTFADSGYEKMIVINKSGVVRSAPTRKSEFDLGSIRENRIGDIRFTLKKMIPKSAAIWLVGESEGAYIAPDIALKEKRIKKMILVSAGTRSWIDEEISFVPETKRADLRTFLYSEVVGHPTLLKRYNGWTYSQLNSFHTDLTYRSLRALEIPILMLNGQRDRNTWVAATWTDVMRLINDEGKSNIEFHFIPEVNHSLGCDAGNKACDPGEVSRTEVDLFRTFMSNH